MSSNTDALERLTVFVGVLAAVFLFAGFIAMPAWQSHSRAINTEELHLHAQSAAYRTHRTVTDTAQRLAEKP